MAVLFTASVLHAFNFTTSKLNGVSIGTGTCLQFGADDRLYVAQGNGEIKILTIQRVSPNNYQVTATEVIDLVRDIPNYNDDGSRNPAIATRQLTGLLVVGTATNPIIYVSSSDPRIGGGSGGQNDLNLDTNSGIISRLTCSGGTWTKVDLVRGLPRSEENHATNGLQLDTATNTLLVAQGGNTNAGGPSNNFAFMCETALSAAILAVDLTALDALPVKTDPYGQNYLYDLPTVDDPNPARAHNPDGTNLNDPFGGNDGLNQAKLVPGGPVQIYATGFRNPYDLVLTRTPGREGRLYAFDNGANAGWGGYPTNEGTDGTVTNQYPAGEPGVVNNRDNLHLITRGFYAGHPNPLRANPAGAGWFHFDNSQPAGAQASFSLTPTTDWPSFPVSMADPIEGDFRQPGSGDGALLTYSASTNGLTEYVANNFGGAMRGNLIAVAYDGKMLRIALSPDGTTVTNGAEVLAGNFGTLPLDVTAPDPGHGAPFLGTIWVIHYTPGKITILEPEDFDTGGGEACTGINSYDIDEDGDGYSNADEIANGSDCCSAAQHPPDADNDHLSDSLDPDDDNDGVPDLSDPFPIDPTNGRSVPAAIHYELFNETGVGFYGVGFTGLMMNPGQDYLTRISDDNVVAGGTAGLFTISQVGSGTARGPANSQMDAYQFAYNSDEFSVPFVVSARLAGPFFNNSPTASQQQGIYVGTGDQDNYISLALHANDGAGGLEVVSEQGGVVVSANLFPLSGLTELSTIDVSFAVDPVAGTLQPRYQLPDGAVIPLGAPVVAGGEVLMALMGRKPLAIGLFATTGASGTPSFSATWDWFDVTPQPSSALAKITIDPPGANMVTASTYNAGSFKIQNLSTGGQQIESVTFDLSTAMLPDVVFDTTGTAGDDVAKPFDADSASDGVTFSGATMTHPHDGASGADGYDATDVAFSAFPAGGTFAFSIDIDPNNLKGVPQPGEHDAASVSGLELIGSTATVYFDDGSVQRTRLGRIENSVDGAYGWARSDKPPTPGLAILGQTSPFVTTQATQTARITGPAGFAVSLVVTETGLYLAGVPGGGYQVQPFDTNTAIAVTEQTGAIGAAGFVDLPVTLTHTDPKAGYNLLTANLVDANGIKGPASAVVVARYDSSTGTTDTSPPSAPGSLTASNVTASSASLAWTASIDDVGVTGYRISRDAGVLATVTALTYDDSNLAASTSYTYSVVALDAAGNASAPATVTFTTPAPPAPTALRINAGGPAYTDSSGRTWSADTGYNTGSTTTSTATVSGTTAPQLFKTERYDAAPAPELTYTFALANGSYTVRLHFAETYSATSATGKRVFDVTLQSQVAFANVDIFARAGGANRALVLEAPVTVTTGQLQLGFIHHVENPKINAIEIIPADQSADTTPPSAPTGLDASGVTASTASLTWTASTDNVAVTGYRVLRDGDPLATVTAPAFDDSGLNASTTYAYSVVALDAASNTSAAATLSVTTPGSADTTPPSAPGPLTFTAITATSLTVNWTAATDAGGVASYRVSRDGTVLGTTASLSFPDSGLAPASSYQYSVVALDAAGNISSASGATGTTASNGGGGATTTFRLNTGGPAYTDTLGHLWSADTGFNTGKVSTETAAVAGTPFPTIFKTVRFDETPSPELTYTLPVPNGRYTVRLHFAETSSSGAGAGLRLFNVDVQGQRAFTNVDIYTQAGGYAKPLALEATADVTSGQMQITFRHVKNNPRVSGIELIGQTAEAADSQPPTAPTQLAATAVTRNTLTLSWTAATDNVGVTGYRISRDGAVLGDVTATTFDDSGLTAGTAYTYSVVALDAAGHLSTPATLAVTTASSGSTVRINAGGPNYTDTLGRVWSADTGFNTGKVSVETGTVTGTSDPTLYKTVRFDEATTPELAYTLPVANGSYTVRLYFAETSSAAKGVGLRVFNIDLQNQRAFTNVDIYAQAGGATKALMLEHAATVTNGQLQIRFLHVKNNPRINAIEIIPAP